MHVFDPINNIFMDIGFLVWYKYSLMILIGMVLAALFGIKEGNLLGIKTDDIIDGILIVVPLSIVGTRLWYVLFELQSYIDKSTHLGSFDFGDFFINVISISDGGLAIHGGFITAFISSYFFTKYKKINVLSAFDIIVPGFLIAQASGRWGNFFNQEAHGGMIGGTDGTGAPLLGLDEQRSFLESTLHLPDFITDNMLIHRTDVSEGFMVPDLSPGSEIGDMIRAAYYHPTFLYESVWNLLGFIVILFIRRTKWLRNGDLLAFYFIWYGFGRFFIEAMRTDSLYVLNTGLRIAQIISLIMIVGAVGYLYITRKIMKARRYHEILDEVKEQNSNAKK